MRPANIKKDNALQHLVESRMKEKTAQEKFILAKKEVQSAEKGYNDAKDIIAKMESFVDSTTEIINSILAKTSKKRRAGFIIYSRNLRF